MELLTTKEVGVELRVSAGTICRWVAQGKIGCIRIGGILRIPRSELSRLLAPASATNHTNFTPRATDTEQAHSH